MATPTSLVPTSSDFDNLHDTYGVSPTEGVEFPIPGAIITATPARKVGIYLKMLDVGLCLPLIDFQEELLHRNGCSVQRLMPNVVHKMMSFEIIC